MILLMIPKEGKKRCHYLAVKKFSRSLRGIRSKYHGDFCFVCLCSLRKEKKLKFHKKYVKIKISVEL